MSCERANSHLVDNQIFGSVVWPLVIRSPIKSRALKVIRSTEDAPILPKKMILILTSEYAVSFDDITS